MATEKATRFVRLITQKANAFLGDTATDTASTEVAIKAATKQALGEKATQVLGANAKTGFR